jgi:hypothetical protein
MVVGAVVEEVVVDGGGSVAATVGRDADRTGAVAQAPSRMLATTNCHKL